jgi:hypothetical protein
MDVYSIAWTESGAEHTKGPFQDGEEAADAARESANRVQQPVRVLRLDGTTFMTIFPAAPTLVNMRRPRA